jgi:hypothetical protein
LTDAGVLACGVVMPEAVAESDALVGFVVDHTAGQANWQMRVPYPPAEDVEKVESKDGEMLTSSTR